MSASLVGSEMCIRDRCKCVCVYACKCVRVYICNRARVQARKRAHVQSCKRVRAPCRDRQASRKLAP
eukprot:14434467-Alexandrium_andersonii.AAC.1